MRAKGLAPSACTTIILGTFSTRPELHEFLERLAERGRVAEVAAGNDQVIGHLPAELFEQLEHGRLLAFEAEGIDRVAENTDRD